MRCSFLDQQDALQVPIAHPERPSPIPSQPASRTASPPAPSTTAPSSTTEDPYHVNLTHLELFRNLTSPEFMSANTDLPDNIRLEVYMNYSLKTPYLMHMVLASSALHLSTICESSSRHFYHDLAMGLQTRALAIFNQSHAVLNTTPGNAVPKFLFTSLLSVYLMFEHLLHPGPDLGHFLHQFTKSLEICCGLLVVVDQSRHLLENTELGPPLEVSRRITQETDPAGSECDVLLDLVSDSHLDAPRRGACEEAVLYLRRTFKAQATVAGGSKPRVLQAVIVWPLLCSSVFRRMLCDGEPHALVILAHYAVLLHRGRHLWYYASGGRWLIEHIRQNLDQTWRHWLDLPSRAIDQ